MPSFAMLLVSGVLVGAGVYLALERSLSRVFIGLSLITNGANLLILAMAGPAGLPPLLGGDWDSIVDPLPQAMILTSIVLSLGTTAFGLALAYRSWRLSGHDEVVDDVEDRRLARLTKETRHLVTDAGVEGTEDPGIVYDLAGDNEDTGPAGEET